MSKKNYLKIYIKLFIVGLFLFFSPVFCVNAWEHTPPGGESGTYITGNTLFTLTWDNYNEASTSEYNWCDDESGDRNDNYTQNEFNINQSGLMVVWPGGNQVIQELDHWQNNYSGYFDVTNFPAGTVIDLGYFANVPGPEIGICDGEVFYENYIVVAPPKNAICATSSFANLFNNIEYITGCTEHYTTSSNPDFIEYHYFNIPYLLFLYIAIIFAIVLIIISLFLKHYGQYSKKNRFRQ